MTPSIPPSTLYSVGNQVRILDNNIFGNAYNGKIGIITYVNELTYNVASHSSSVDIYTTMTTGSEIFHLPFRHDTVHLASEPPRSVWTSRLERPNMTNHEPSIPTLIYADWARPQDETSTVVPDDTRVIINSEVRYGPDFVGRHGIITSSDEVGGYMITSRLGQPEHSYDDGEFHLFFLREDFDIVQSDNTTSRASLGEQIMDGAWRRSTVGGKVSEIRDEENGTSVYICGTQVAYYRNLDVEDAETPTELARMTVQRLRDVFGH